MPTQAVQPAGAQPITFLQRVAALWLKLLLGGLGAMLVGWTIQTDAFLSLVNWVLLIGGVVAVLIFFGTKNPTYLVGGAIALVVRFMHLFDWAVNAVWIWLVIAGVAAAIAGAVVGIVNHRGAIGRTGSALVLVAGICVSAVKRSAASGELVRVVVGVVAVVFAIIAATVGLIVWMVSRQGW